MAERHTPNLESLKIAISVPYSMEPTGGVQQHAKGYGRYLLSQGHEVIAISAKNPQVEEQQHVDWASSRVFLSEAVPHRHNGTIAHVPRRVPTNPVEIHRAWQRIDADILHSHDPYLSSAALELIIYSRLPKSDAKRVHNFATFHAFNEDDKPMYRIIGLLRYGFDPLLDGTIVVSAATQQFAQRFYKRDHRLIPNGIDTTQFTQETECLERFKDGKTNILYVGRLEERKGVKYLLEAYARAKTSHPQTRLIIAGDGPQRCELESLVADGPIQDVEFLGKISDEDLPKVYNTADICVFLATHGEAQGLVLLEAMAAGKPVIAGNNPGYSTVINQMENGILTDPKNTALSSANLIHLIENQDLRGEMSRAGQVTALSYDWQNVGKQILDYYKQQISGK